MKKRRAQALSLLEILFAIGFLTVILVAFAAIYPASYRLNRKSAKATIAAKTASNVSAEILSLPFDPPSFSSGQPNLTNLALDTNGTQAIKTFVTQQMRSTVPPGFEVRAQAIHVALYGTSNGPFSEVGGRFAQVQVTTYYNDSNSGAQEKSVTVVSGKAENRDVR
ncbi:MAG: hypothetical protein U0931_09365 [Vulcanimicrobiota bacterium]